MTRVYRCGGCFNVDAAWVHSAARFRYDTEFRSGNLGARWRR